MDFLTNENVKYFYCASDLVVLPYTSATQSGIIPIAYHFNKPVVSSNVGGLPENIQNNKTGIICEPNPETIANWIINYFDSDLFIYKENIEEYNIIQSIVNDILNEYDENDNLIMVAEMSRPYRKEEDKDLTFKLKYDLL